jgi:hypothetical protein
MALAACAHAPPTALRIDGSSPDTFQASWDRMRNSLSPSERSQLEIAVLPIALGKYHSFVDVPPSLLNGIGPQTIRTEIDGLSYPEILALAQKQPIKVSLPNHP